jgi:hypothetical protein
MVLKNYLFGACALLTIAACGGSPSPGLGDAQTPPTTGHDAIETWLTAGSYKQWHCEQAVHAPRSPSPHVNMNKICSNTLLSGAPAGVEYPVGAAAVKELYDAAGTTINGYAV